MTIAIETDSPEVAAPTYEVVFCAPGEALGAKNPQWFIEGCYAEFEEAQRAARALLESTNDQLHTVTILHARFDAARGAFRERVVWSQDRTIALLSRLNLQPLETGQRQSIVAHFGDHARRATEPGPALDIAEVKAPSPVLVGLAGTLTAAFCAAGVLLVLT